MPVIFKIKKDILQYSTYSEAHLWDTFKAGDDKAFEYIYTMFGTGLFEYGIHLCNNPQLAEDCMHDLFVKIFNRREHLGSTTSIKYYLMRSFRREISDALKKNIKLSGKDLSETKEYNFLFEQNAESAMMKKETNDLLSSTMIKEINNLPKKQREIIYLIFYNGLNYDEAAKILELTVRTVYNQVYNALQRLRELNNVFKQFLVA